MQLLAQRANEVLIACWLRADNIHRPVQAVTVQRKENDACNVIKRDPAPVLLAAANASPKPQPERQKHRRQRAAIPSQHDADSQVHHSYACIARRIRGGFPLQADVSQIASAGRTLLSQHLVAAIAVITDCRSADKRTW